MKLTALVAVLLVCLLLFPTAAFAYASDGEDAPAETPAAQNADAVPRADTTETVETQNRQMIRKTPHVPLMPMS